MYDYRPFYESLEKPFFAPEPEVFGLAWGVIYPLIIVTLLFLFVKYRRKAVSLTTLALLLLNMAGNLLFTPVQLGLEGLLPATFVLLFVLVTLVLVEVRLWKESRTAFVLLVPYLVWVSFASILQLSLLVLN